VLDKRLHLNTKKTKKKYQSAWRMDIIHAGEALGMFTPEGFLE